MKAWMRRFSIPEVQEVPDDFEERQASLLRAHDQLRTAQERNTEVVRVVAEAKKHMSRNHYAQRMYEAVYGAKP